MSPYYFKGIYKKKIRNCKKKKEIGKKNREVEKKYLALASHFGG
jgi:hypothetical protein